MKHDFPTFFCLDENGNDGAPAVMTWYLPLLPTVLPRIITTTLMCPEIDFG